MYPRRISKQIKIGDVKIGGDAPISVQSMCNTDTRDVKATINQIKELQNVGCELIRLAVLNKDAANAIKEIKKHVQNNSEIFHTIVGSDCEVLGLWH